MELRAEKEAFRSNYTNIVGTIQDSLPSIRDGCFEEYLITDGTHKELLHEKDIPYEKATKLFEAVRNTLKTKSDANVFKAFLDILRKEIGSDSLVQCVETAKEDALQRMVRTQCMEDIRKSVRKGDIVASEEEHDQWRVIKDNLPQLTEDCTPHLSTIASECNTEHIISEKVY